MRGRQSQHGTSRRPPLQVARPTIDAWRANRLVEHPQELFDMLGIRHFADPARSIVG